MLDIKNFEIKEAATLDPEQAATRIDAIFRTKDVPGLILTVRGIFPGVLSEQANLETARWSVHRKGDTLMAIPQKVVHEDDSRFPDLDATQKIIERIIRLHGDVHLGIAKITANTSSLPPHPATTMVN